MAIFMSPPYQPSTNVLQPKGPSTVVIVMMPGGYSVITQFVSISPNASQILNQPAVGYPL